MNVKELAAHYMRYWQQGEHGRELADNAPRDFWRFVFGLPKTTDRHMIYLALKGVADGVTAEVPPTQEMLAWFARNPHAYKHFDDILGQTHHPRKFNELVEKAYKRELFSVSDHIFKFIHGQLTKS